MPVYPVEPALGDHLADHDRRLQALESSPQLGNSSIKGGALVIYDDTFPGNIVGLFGAFSDTHFGGTVHGLVVQSAAGQPLLVTHDLGGVLYPYQQWGWWEAYSTTRTVFAGSGEACTSTSASPTWETLWAMQTELVTATYLKTGVRVITPVGTTAEVRMIVNGGTPTSTKAIAANTDATLACFWQHGLALATGPLGWEMQIRISGAGPVIMFKPKAIAMTDWSTLAVTGGWV